MQQAVPDRQVFFSSALASLAALAVFSLWQTAAFRFLQDAFLLRQAENNELVAIPFWVGASVAIALGIVSAVSVERWSARRVVPVLALGTILSAFASLLASWFLSTNILFIPIVFALAVSTFTVQCKKLWVRSNRLTAQLKESARKLSSLEANDAHSRLLSGLRLIETVLHPKETIVFRLDDTGRLSAAARLRASNSGPLETSRNSSWRDGVTLCELAIKKGKIVDQRNGAVYPISLALPLRHESRTVGALLIRLGNEFDDNDRTLLSAVGAQMARNLQREEVFKSVGRGRRLSFFSASAADKKVESLFVLNGLLTEQRFGVGALTQVSEGLAIAYLDGTIAYTNPNFLKYVDLTREQAKSLDLLGLLEKLRTDVFDEPSIAVRRVLQTGEPYVRELHFSERAVTYALRISLILARSSAKKKEPLCLAIHVSDVTRVKEHEQLKSDMVSLMSHELRTPITSINGFAELLAAEKDLPDSAREFVTIIANESQRLSRMINTFLAVSKLQRKDKQEVLKIPLRLDEVAREIVASFQPVARKRRIRLVEQPAPRIPPVAADKSLISQAVKNLVSNAIKYSPEKTTVTVTTELEAEAVRVSVEDRGYGIPAEARDRVWEKFYRVVRDGQEKDDESTGLGLSFVREVVEQHGGQVELETEEGRGSKFSFTLPRL